MVACKIEAQHGHRLLPSGTSLSHLLAQADHEQHGLVATFSPQAAAALTAAAFAHEGLAVVVADSRGRVLQLDLTDNCTTSVQKKGLRARCIECMHDDTALSFDNGEVVVINSKSGHAALLKGHHRSAVLSISSLKDTLLLTASSDRCVLYQSDDEGKWHSVHVVRGSIAAAQLVPTAQLMAVLATDSSIALWSTAGNCKLQQTVKPPPSLSAVTASVSCFAASPSAALLVTAGGALLHVYTLNVHAIHLRLFLLVVFDIVSAFSCLTEASCSKLYITLPTISTNSFSFIGSASHCLTLAICIRLFAEWQRQQYCNAARHCGAAYSY
jgi:WD40 repeat protein